MGEFDIDRWATKLNKWWVLDFVEFIKILKVKLSLQQKDELLQLFEKYRTELIDLNNQLQRTDQEIDRLVYKLYGLTDKEVGIVEES